MRRSAVMLLLCALMTGCDRSPKPAEAPTTQPATLPKVAAPANVPDFEFQPLTHQHVGLYLAVMRQAVEKRKQLPEADKAVLAAEADYYKHLKSGWHPSPTPSEVSLFKRADELHHLDNEVARQQGKFELYAAVREAVEGMVGPRKCGDSDCGQGVPEDDPVLRKQQIEDDKKRKAIIRQDLVLLKPFIAEISTLAKQLR